jgi:putative membrane protein insertion efficiency factor
MTVARAMRAPVLALIRLYQQHGSPRPAARRCRFEPTCSQYAYEAVDRYGVIRGGLLTCKRIARCHPRTPAGADPVP